MGDLQVGGQSGWYDPRRSFGARYRYYMHAQAAQDSQAGRGEGVMAGRLSL